MNTLIIPCAGKSNRFPNMKPKERKERIRHYTELVEYNKSLVIRPASLSIGEQKKISFARALICEPEILFLDEPTESIDEKTEELFITILKKLISENISKNTLNLVVRFL